MLFKMRSAYFVAAISSVLTIAAVASAAYKADSPEIVFHAKGPLGLSIDGKSDKLIVEENDKTVTFKTFLNTLGTGNGKRNDHMQQRLGRIQKKGPDGKYLKDSDGKPVWEEKLELGIKLSVPKDKIDTVKGGTIDGTLTLHRVSKSVPVTYKIEGSRVSANFAFNVHDFFPFNDVWVKEDRDNMLCNTGVCAKPDVKVEVAFNYK